MYNRNKFNREEYNDEDEILLLGTPDYNEKEEDEEILLLPGTPDNDEKMNISNVSQNLDSEEPLAFELNAIDENYEYITDKVLKRRLKQKKYYRNFYSKMKEAINRYFTIEDDPVNRRKYIDYLVSFEPLLRLTHHHLNIYESNFEDVLGTKINYDMPYDRVFYKGNTNSLTLSREEREKVYENNSMEHIREFQGKKSDKPMQNKNHVLNRFKSILDKFKQHVKENKGGKYDPNYQRYIESITLDDIMNNNNNIYKFEEDESSKEEEESEELYLNDNNENNNNDDDNRKLKKTTPEMFYKHPFKFYEDDNDENQDITMMMTNKIVKFPWNPYFETKSKVVFTPDKPEDKIPYHLRKSIDEIPYGLRFRIREDDTIQHFLIEEPIEELIQEPTIIVNNININNLPSSNNNLPSSNSNLLSSNNTSSNDNTGDVYLIDNNSDSENELNNLNNQYLSQPNSQYSNQYLSQSSTPDTQVISQNYINEMSNPYYNNSSQFSTSSSQSTSQSTQPMDEHQIEIELLIQKEARDRLNNGYEDTGNQLDNIGLQSYNLYGYDYYTSSSNSTSNNSINLSPESDNIENQILSLTNSSKNKSSNLGIKVPINKNFKKSKVKKDSYLQ